MIPYKFKGAASALYFTDGTREIIEHENGSYSARTSKVNIGNSSEFVLRGHFKPVKHRFSCALQSGAFTST